MQPTTTERIALSVAPESVQLAPGRQITVVLAATNQGPVVDQFGLLVEGLDSAWYTIRQGFINLFPSATGNFELDIHLPDGPEAVAGVHEAVLKVASREAPGTVASIRLPIDVIALGGIQASLRPERMAIGRRGRGQCTLKLVNNGNADSVVDLTVRDPEEALNVQVSPDRLSVPHGGAAEAQLTVVPRQRPIVSTQRQYTFMVEAVPAVAADQPAIQAPEVVAVVVGELIYRPPFATLAALPLGLRRLLMALAALALLAALLIWFLAAPGRRGALIERVPATKPAVAAVESALSLPDKVAGPSASDGGAGGANQAPQIKRFELATPGQDGRTDYALIWQVDGADKVTIGGVEQPDPTSGSLHLDKLENTEYVLEASKGGVIVNQSVGIVILRPPDVQELSATPDSISAGQTATLRWKAARGDRATLADKSVDPTGGNLDVSPATTTSYTLSIENELGRTERSVQVRVTDPTPSPKP